MSRSPLYDPSTQATLTSVSNAHVPAVPCPKANKHNSVGADSSCPSPMYRLMVANVPCPKASGQYSHKKNQPISQMSRATQTIFKSQCPMSQTNRAAFKFQINPTIFRTKKTNVAYVPAVSSPKPTRRYLSRKIKFSIAYVPAVPMSPDAEKDQRNKPILPALLAAAVSKVDKASIL